MATQHLYKQKYIDKLISEVEKGVGLERYEQNVCPFSTEHVFNIVGIEHPEGLLEEMMKQPMNDCNNAILLYESFPSLTPLQASDNRFWLYMAHVDLYKYMYTRWPLSEAKNLPEYIKEHWLGSRGFMRQGLSNLWWSVYLTIDESNEDKYALTKYMFEHQDFRTRRFASGVFARNREGMIGLLTGMMNSDAYDHYFEARSIFAIMYFNHLGGTRQLSALSRSFFIEEMKRIDPEVRKHYNRDDVFNNPHLFDNL